MSAYDYITKKMIKKQREGNAEKRRKKREGIVTPENGTTQGIFISQYASTEIPTINYESCETGTLTPCTDTCNTVMCIRMAYDNGTYPSLLELITDTSYQCVLQKISSLWSSGFCGNGTALSTEDFVGRNCNQTIQEVS